MSSAIPFLNRPFIAKLTDNELKYVSYSLKQEMRSFESDKTVLFFFWLIIPSSQFLKNIQTDEKFQDYLFVLLILLPFVSLAGWLLYRNRIKSLKNAIDRNDKTVISTSIEDMEIDAHNSVILYTSYQNHKVFKLGNVIGKIRINKPITISYFEGCDRVIDFNQ